MEQEDNLHKGSLTHTEHDDVSDDRVSGTMWDGNVDDDTNNAPTGPVIQSMIKGHNLKAKGFFHHISECKLVNQWLKKMFLAVWGPLKPMI